MIPFSCIYPQKLDKHLLVFDKTIKQYKTKNIHLAAATTTQVPHNLKVLHY